MSAPWSPTGETTPRIEVVDQVVVEVRDGAAQLVDQADDQVDRLDPVQRARCLPRPRGVRMAS